MSLALDIKHSFGRDADNFTCQLFRLIRKANRGNLERLRDGFPLEVKMHEIWLTGELGTDYEAIERKAKGAS